MDEQAKVSDLTVAEFRQLMQQCFDADRKAEKARVQMEQAQNLGMIGGAASGMREWWMPVTYPQQSVTKEPAP